MHTTTTTLTLEDNKDFVRVPNSILRALDKTSVDLYLMQEDCGAPLFYRGAGYELAEDRAKDLASTCPGELYVQACDYEKFRNGLVDSLGDSMGSEDLPPDERFELMQCAVSLEIEHSLRLVSVDSYVEKTQQVGRQIVELVNDNQVLPGDLFDIVRHDHHTFVHVTNVAGYVTLLAKEMGISDVRELEKIAIGGLLHDLGKRKIPAPILNKKGKLTPDEWDIIRQHPRTGYEDLCKRDDLDRGQLMMVYQHHEHISGEGYPVGVTDDEIHPWAKMLAVVDVFDALTGERPYRSPATCEETLEMLNQKAGTQFDPEVVACWTSAMQQR